MRRLYRSYAAGASFSELAKTANSEGWPTPRRGRQWETASIRNILRNPFYIGMVRHGDQVLPGRHEPLIGARLWQSVQARIEARAYMHPRSLGSPTSLAPLFRCGVCGGSVRITVGKRPGRSGRYGCSDDQRRLETERHEPTSGTCTKLEAVVWEYTAHLLGNGALEEGVRLHRERQRASDDAGERAEAEARLATGEQQIRLNIQYAASNLLPADMVEEQQRPLIEERERLRARLTEIGAPPALADKDVRWLRDVGTRALELLRAGDAGRQREFLARIYGQVNLWRDRMEFHHRVPLPPAQVRIPRRYDPSQGLLIDIDDLLL